MTITDNDTAGVTVSESSLTIVKGSTKKTYTVVLATKPTADVTDHCDERHHRERHGRADSAHVHRRANWDTAQTFTVSGVATGASTITHASSSTDDNHSTRR